jgi:SagB-type dehydrogenase family enzyme
MKFYRLTLCFILAFIVSESSLTFAQDREIIRLPEPQTEIGKPLMQALKLRHSTREYSSKKLPFQEISNLLWAAWGINRIESGRRTAPSMSNRQTIDIYVAFANGLYLYNAKENSLNKIIDKDIREMTGRQEFTKNAPVNLIYVADFTRMSDKMPDEQKTVLSSADTGYISQNVYLYCASEGLATVVYHSINKADLEKEMGLSPDQKVIMAQSVGYPKE